MATSSRHSVGDYSYFDSRATSEDPEEVMLATFAAPMANMTTNTSAAATEFKTRSKEDEEREEAEVLAQVARENAEREAADEDFTPRRSKRPHENTSAKSSKRPRTNVETSKGAAISAKKILRVHTRHQSASTEARRKELVFQIAEHWSNDYGSWPILTASTRGLEPTGPRDWGVELLEEVLQFARESKQRGLPLGNVHSTLRRAFDNRRDSKAAATNYLQIADVQKAIQDLTDDTSAREATGARARSPTFARGGPEDDEHDNISSNGFVLDTNGLDENAMEPPEENPAPTDARQGRDAAQATSATPDQERLETMPLTQALAFMNARAIRNLGRKLIAIAETFDTSIATLTTDEL